MTDTLFNIGLSHLSRKEGSSLNSGEEARRILSIFTGKTFTENDILREENGRPHFKHSTSDFNISHSGDMLAVSYVRGESLRTGCDVQIVKERANTLRIAEQFFTPDENKYILTQKEKGNKAAFFEIWTLKECYIKLHGLSVFDMTSVPSFAYESGQLKLVIDDISFYQFKVNDDKERQYILTAAIQGSKKEPVILRL